MTSPASSDVIELVARTTSFVRERVLPVEDALGGDIERRRWRRRAAGAAGGRPRQRGCLARTHPSSTAASGSAWWIAGTGVRGGGVLAVRTGGAQHRRTGRGQRPPARTRGDSPEQQERVPPAPGAGRGAVRVRDDRAGSRRRLGPERADDARPTRSPAAGGSTAASGSSPARTAPGSSSSWPAPRVSRATAAARRCSSCRRTPPGSTVGRHIGTLDRSMVGGHCEVSFDDAVRPRRRGAR